MFYRRTYNLNLYHIKGGLYISLGGLERFVEAEVESTCILSEFSHCLYENYFFPLSSQRLFTIMFQVLLAGNIFMESSFITKIMLLLATCVILNHH